ATSIPARRPTVDTRLSVIPKIMLRKYSPRVFISVIVPRFMVLPYTSMALLQHKAHDERPWGSFDQFTKDERVTVKIITVAPEKRFSLQYHERRSEFWRIIA